MAVEPSQSFSNTPRLESNHAVYPLSPMQQGLLFHALCAPNSDAYINQLSARLDGPLNVDAFVKAWQLTIDRYSILRTRFIWDDLRQPLQTFVENVVFSINLVDWRALSTEHQAKQLVALMETDRRQAFDLSHPPLMRATLIRLSEQTHRFLWTYHHLILDGWSLVLVLRHISIFYESACRGETPTLKESRPYCDYINWLQRQDTTTAEAFWRRAFSPAPRCVPVRSLLQPSEREQYETQQIHLSSHLTASLNRFARDHHLTMSTLLHAAWAILLGRYNQADDVVFGTVVSGRPAELTGVDSIVGLFINTLPMRVALRLTDWLLPWLQDLQLYAASVREHQYTPLATVQAYASCPGGHALFDSFVCFDNYSIDPSLRYELADLRLSDIFEFGRSHYAVAFKAVPGRELSLTIIYDCARLYRTAVTGILNDLTALLTRITIQPHVRLQALMVPAHGATEPDRRQAVLGVFNEPFALD